MCYQVIDGLLGDVPIWGTPGGGIMPGHQPVAVSAADADAAFGGLYAEHGPALLRLATVLTGGDRGRAEDLVQETMLRAWTHRANLDIQHRSPRAWLITVARRLAVDAHRARRARPAEVELDEHLELAGGQRADASIDEVGVRAQTAHDAVAQHSAAALSPGPPGRRPRPGATPKLLGGAGGQGPTEPRHRR
jgi:RNA polymerase sigma-70 factor, ECF subfamily